MLPLMWVATDVTLPRSTATARRLRSAGLSKRRRRHGGIRGQGLAILSDSIAGVLASQLVLFCDASPKSHQSAGQRGEPTGIITVSPVTKESAPLETIAFANIELL